MDGKTIDAKDYAINKLQNRIGELETSLAKTEFLTIVYQQKIAEMEQKLAEYEDNSNEEENNE